MTQRVTFSLDLKSSQPSLKKNFMATMALFKIYHKHHILSVPPFENFKKYSHGFKKSQTNHLNT